MLKVLMYAGSAALILLIVVISTGLILPQDHTATVRVRIRQRPQKVYDAIVDVAHAKSWRSDLDSVVVLSRPGEALRWKETTRNGTLTYEMELANPPQHVATRIVGGSEAFGGGWVYEIDGDPIGTVVTIRENGEVYNPIFRFMSHFIFGYYGSLETYAKDLGRHFGSEVTPERVLR